MVKRVLLIVAFGPAAMACNSTTSSSAPVETGRVLESPSAPVESPAAPPSS